MHVQDGHLVRNPFPAAPPRAGPSPAPPSFEGRGRGEGPLPPSSRFSAGTSFACGEVEDGKHPPSHACPHPRQPPRRPALREDAVEIRYRPPPTSGNRETPQRWFQLLFPGRGGRPPAARRFPAPEGTCDCPSSLTSRQRGVRKPDHPPGPAPPADGCVRAARPPSTCVSTGTPKAIPLPGGFP